VSHARPLHRWAVATTLIVVLRYAITHRALFPGDDQQQQAALVRQASRWAADGIDIVQLREKALPAATLATLARNILQTLQGTPTRLVINSRPDIGIATAAHGVHLTAAPGELTPTQICHLYASAHLPPPIVTISCHTLAEVEQARTQQPDAILFAPVFEKSIAGQIVTHEQYGAVFQKGSPLVQPFDQAIAKLWKNGTVAKLQQKWFAINFARVPVLK